MTTSYSNMQPSLALTEYIQYTGLYPGRDDSSGDTSFGIGFLGIFAGNFDPDGLAANGAVLPIAQYQALYSIVVDSYGDDGASTFGLPNLVGVTMIGAGQGPGLPPENIGDQIGSSTFSVAPAPAHAAQTINDYQPSLGINYVIAVDGLYPVPSGTTPMLDELGMVEAFAGGFAPDGYMEAAGQLLPINQYLALYSLLGNTYGGDGITTFALPDLRGRDIIGAGNTVALGQQLGAPTVTLSSTPEQQTVNNEQPSLGLQYLIALNGIYPSHDNASGSETDTPYIGQIVAFAGSIVPSGYAVAAGQLLPITQYQALYSILGTDYGGDGRTTFALPDLRGKVVVGTSASQLPGTVSGANSETVTLYPVPPSITALVGQPVNGGHVELKGTGENVGDTISLYQGGTLVGTGTITSQTLAYDITTTATFADGVYPFTATETHAGLTSLASGGFQVAVDPTPPSITGLVGVAGRNSPLELTGTGEAGKFIALYADGNEQTIVGTGSVGDDGTFDIKTTATFQDGPHTFNATEWDTAELTSAVSADFDVEVVACYCRGTTIMTPRGAVPVETLAIGDEVIVGTGGSRPIKWVGRRRYASRFALGNKRLLPVCIAAGAIDDQTPARDLWISPQHAMYLDGVLVEAKDLVNGTSVRQSNPFDTIDYFHIELDTHDVILAEGAWSETFVDDDTRGLFHNADEYGRLYAAAAPAAARYCAPRIEQGERLERIRSALAERAATAQAA